MKISALAALIAVLSTLATSVAQAMIQPGHGGEVHSSQVQGQNGGVHTDAGNGGANGGDIHK
jgi:hypothetical protein